MLNGLKQFVPSSVCLACDGCCRFKEKDSVWRPRITQEEIARKNKPDLLSVIYAKENVDAQGYLKTTSCGDGPHLCSFFSAPENACTIYDARPFECRLYPFVLIKKDNCAAIAAHHACPFIQEKRHDDQFEKYVGYLKGFFEKKEVREFLKRNPSMAGEYKDYENELEYLFTVL